MKNKKIILKITGWIVSIIAAIIGTYSISSSIIKQDQNQRQQQALYINVGDDKIELREDNAQAIYDELDSKVKVADEMLTELEVKIDSLKDENNKLFEENKKYQGYGTDALVSKEKDYDANKVSLLAFSPVNASQWEPNQGTLKDSLDNNYSVTLPYIVIHSGSYSEYYTNGLYKVLSFKIAPHESMSQDTAAQVKVYADDILVFTSQDIDRKTEMQTYSANIDGAKFIKITCERILGYGDSSVLILDSTLEK